MTSDGTQDIEFTFGRPVTTYLDPRSHVRLTILRSRIQNGERAADDWQQPAPHRWLMPAWMQQARRA